MIGFEDQELEARFSRQQGLEGWDQPRLREAGCLVVGAGALGNELLKNLALLGVGELGVIDFDRVEESNLPRCTLFRQGDIGRPKALVAQEQLLAMAPGLRCTAYLADVMTEVGAGLLETYDLVLGAVDSVAARWQINRLARRAGVSWIDAGVDHFCGQVTRFDAASGACYECGMTARMWQHIFERHSCAAPAEASPLRPMIPLALPVVSVTAGLQAQEAVYLLMGSDGAGETPLQPGERLSISLRPYELLRLSGRRRSSCLTHAANNAAALPLGIRREDSVVALLRTAGAHGLQLEWEVVYELRCTRCGAAECVLPLWQLGRDALRCPMCGSARTTEQTSMVSLESRLAACTLRELGVPAQAHLQLLVSKGAEPCWYKIL